MRALTPAWTERHTAVAVAMATGTAAQLVALGEDGPVAWWVAAAVAVTALGALAFDGWGGALVGLFVAVGLVAVRRATGHWSAEVFWPAALETAACIGLGACSGAAGSLLRRRGGATTGSLFHPVHGSLGLIGAEAALGRLEEELARGRRLQRPVALVLLDIEPTDSSLPAEGRTAARRAVARLVESRVAEQDVPFALAEDRLGVICPETSPTMVWEMVGRVLESLRTATFTFGTDRTARALVDAVDVTVGIAHQSEKRATAADVLDDAVAVLTRARADEVTR